MFACASAPALAQFAGGDGSREKPWEIQTPAQLDAIRNHLDKHFILKNDIDLGGADPNGAFWNGGLGWEPIGWGTVVDGKLGYRPFTGSLDGDRHTISELFIKRPDALGYVGLFSVLGGEIKDLELSGITVQGNIGVGGLAGFNGGVLANVSVSGKLAGKGFAGPLTGYNYGVLKGLTTAPLALVNTTVGIGSTLEYVIVGQDNHFEIGEDLSTNYIAKLGRGVRFVNDAYIPAGIDLSPALPALAWDGNPVVTAVNLRADVLVHVAGQPLQTVLGAVERLPEYAEPGQFEQNSVNGEVTIRTADSLSRVLPVRVIQSDGSLPPGTYRTGNGDLLVITDNRRAIIAWPLLLSPDFFRSQVQARGLIAETTTTGDLRLTAADGSYFAARPLAATQAPAGATEGLISRSLEDMANVAEHALVFRSQEGALMEQPLVPRPADWRALEAGLLQVPELHDPVIDPDGTIMAVLRGVERKGRVSYRVSAKAGIGSGTAATLALAGDLNADGALDYLITYPNGDQQFLFVYPR